MSFALKRHMAARAASADDSQVPSWARRFTPAVERSAEEQAEIEAAGAVVLIPASVPASAIVSDDAIDDADDAEVVEADADATDANDVDDGADGSENANAPLSLLGENAKAVIAALDTGDNDDYLDALLAVETGANGKNRKTVKAAITSRLATLDAAT